VIKTELARSPGWRSRPAGGEWENETAVTYLRMTVAEWSVDLDAPEGQRLVELIRGAGVGVFQRQPGFIRYRLMRAGPMRSIAVAEWESEELAMRGSANYRAWLESSGIRDHITMTTEMGPILVSAESSE
jgi:Antibiotic biosynthesis monooxygenase